MFIGGINDQFSANRFLIFRFLVAGFYCTSPQMGAFLFFMASVVFVKHTMTFLSLLQPPTTHLWTVLFSTNGKKNEVKTVMSRLTLFPSLVAEIEARYINSLQGEEPENEINCFMQKERGP